MRTSADIYLISDKLTWEPHSVPPALWWVKLPDIWRSADSEGLLLVLPPRSHLAQHNRPYPTWPHAVRSQVYAASNTARYLPRGLPPRAPGWECPSDRPAWRRGPGRQWKWRPVETEGRPPAHIRQLQVLYWLNDLSVRTFSLLSHINIRIKGWYWCENLWLSLMIYFLIFTAYTFPCVILYLFLLVFNYITNHAT